MPQVPKSLFWAGNYYGSQLLPDHYEILTVKEIPHKERNGESALMEVKWFDYRLMHPMQATYYFAHLYKQAYKDFIRRSMNYEAAPYVQAFKERDFLDSRERMSFWRLRRLVDQLGMRYDFFLHFAMNHLHKMIGGGKVYPPRPAMLGKNEDLLEAAVVAWDDLCASSLQIAASSSYRVAQFSHRFSKHQRAHEQFVIKQLRRRRQPHYGLHAAMYLYDVVRIEAALEAFSEETVMRAIGEV